MVILPLRICRHSFFSTGSTPFSQPKLAYRSITRSSLPGESACKPESSRSDVDGVSLSELKESAGDSLPVAFMSDFILQYSWIRSKQPRHCTSDGTASMKFNSGNVGREIKDKEVNAEVVSRDPPCLFAAITVNTANVAKGAKSTGILAGVRVSALMCKDSCERQRGLITYRGISARPIISVVSLTF